MRLLPVRLSKFNEPLEVSSTSSTHTTRHLSTSNKSIEAI
jgi:hypothetical protein